MAPRSKLTSQQQVPATNASLGNDGDSRCVQSTFRLRSRSEDPAGRAIFVFDVRSGRAFSGTLQRNGAVTDEAKFNAGLIKQCGQGEAHKHADVLVVCDRFDTGFVAQFILYCSLRRCEPPKAWNSPAGDMQQQQGSTSK